MDSTEELLPSRELSDYVLSALFPECVTITDGQHITKSVQITKGDIIVLKSCDAKSIRLTYRDSVSGRRRNVDVSIECPQKFMVLPPKESASSRAVSVIMYPSVSDLLIDSPTYFEATSSDDDPLHGTSINRGDRFRFKGIAISPNDSSKICLKALDAEDNLVFLDLDRIGNFYPLEDTHCYTLTELVSLAPVPRRLKIVEKNSQSSNTNLNDASESCQDLSTIGIKDTTDSTPSKLSNSLNDISGLPMSGVVHMLKPEMCVRASPLNDPDTLWSIPMTANIHVREYVLDDYEVPTAVIGTCGKLFNTVSSHDADIEIPNYPAPPTPPLTQPLIPVKANNFCEIYSSSFPVKAKIMDSSECSEFYKNVLSDCSDVTIHRVENTRRLYAKELKTDSVYSLSKSAKVSFIEYPQKFNSVSELVNLAVGTDVVVLEDMASDFPRYFTLQFGDIIRITSNIPVMIKVKHTNLECKVLKCERLTPDKSSMTKVKLPLDLEVSMVISTDHFDKKVITIQELLSGKAELPIDNVASLIDNEDSKLLQDLPPNLGDLQILPEKLLVASLHNLSQQNPQARIVGISVNSGLVLAFRQRLESSARDLVRSISGADVVQQPMEVLSRGQFEERKQMSKKVWTEEEVQETESISSNDKSSTSGESLHRANSMGYFERKEKRSKDRVRRLSRALNPKNWRTAKAAPDPLPHPEAMGLMALSVRPHYEKPNEYLFNLKSSQAPSLDQTMSSIGASSDEDEENNIYEDVEIRPISVQAGQSPKSGPFSGPLHKSLPLPRNRARRAKEKASQAASKNKNDDKEIDSKASQPSTVADSTDGKKKPIDEFEDDEHVYESPDVIDFNIPSKMHDIHQNTRHKSQTERASQPVPSSHYVTAVPEVKPRSRVKSDLSDCSNEHNNAIESDERPGYGKESDEPCQTPDTQINLVEHKSMTALPSEALPTSPPPETKPRNRLNSLSKSGISDNKSKKILSDAITIISDVNPGNGNDFDQSCQILDNPKNDKLRSMTELPSEAVSQSSLPETKPRNRARSCTASDISDHKNDLNDIIDSHKNPGNGKAFNNSSRTLDHHNDNVQHKLPSEAIPSSQNVTTLPETKPRRKGGSDTNPGNGEELSATQRQNVQEEPPVPQSRKKKVSSQSSDVEEQLVVTDTASYVDNKSSEVSNEDDLTKDNYAKPPVPKPRGIKKMSHLNLADNHIEKEKSSQVPEEITDVNPVQGEETHNEVSKLRAVQSPPVMDRIKPKLPPKPKLIPK